MKKLASLMLGLAFLLGTVTFAADDDKKDKKDQKEEQKDEKKEKKDPPPPAGVPGN